MFYIPFQQLFLIGPAIFFYTKSLLNPDYKFEAKDWMHFVPAAAYLIYRMVISIVDVLLLNEPFFYADGKDKNLDNWYQIAGFISMLVYLLLSLRYYSFYKKIIFQTLSFADTLIFSWVRKYLLAFLLMQILWLLFFCFYPQWGNFKEKWWYYLSFSVLLYYIGITGYANNIKSLVGFKIPGFKNRPVYLLDNNYSHFEHENLIEVEEKDLNPSNNDPELEDWKTKIRDLIEKEKLYSNQNLTLLDVAKKLNTNQTLVSKMINKGFGMNFNDFINEYRVKAVMDLLKQGEHKTHNLLGISLDCGFNSKTTFNRCFKKYTGLSPKQFAENLDKENPGKAGIITKTGAKS